MGNTGTVLIVDDDPSIRTMVVEMLSLEGYSVEKAANGQEALDRLAHAPFPRVVLLDLLMPVLDGRGFMDALRAEPEKRAQLKIILVSAWSNLEAARDLDPDGVLPKPFTLTQLTSVLEPLMASV